MIDANKLVTDLAETVMDLSEFDNEHTVRCILEVSLAPLFAENAHLRAEVETKEREIVRLWNVVCDNPACTGAVIRREDGRRYCAEGHPARWVNVDLLYRLEAEIAHLREKSP